MPVTDADNLWRRLSFHQNSNTLWNQKHCSRNSRIMFHSTLQTLNFSGWGCETYPNLDKVRIFSETVFQVDFVCSFFEPWCLFEIWLDYTCKLNVYFFEIRQAFYVNKKYIKFIFQNSAVLPIDFLIIISMQIATKQKNFLKMIGRWTQQRRWIDAIIYPFAPKLKTGSIGKNKYY